MSSLGVIFDCCKILHVICKVLRAPVVGLGKNDYNIRGGMIPAAGGERQIGINRGQTC